MRILGTRTIAIAVVLGTASLAGVGLLALAAHLVARPRNQLLLPGIRLRKPRQSLTRRVRATSVT
jgi:hypothetical protein